MQREADLIAKALRNELTLSAGQKEAIALRIVKWMLQEDQFFNKKRFLDIAVHEFPTGWPNKVDDAWKSSRSTPKLR